MQPKDPSASGSNGFNDALQDVNRPAACVDAVHLDAPGTAKAEVFAWLKGL